MKRCVAGSLGGQSESTLKESVETSQSSRKERFIVGRPSTGQKPVTYEEEFVTKSGELLAFLNGFSPVLTQNGLVSKVLGYRYDITDHKKTAWALQESLARLQAILETAGDGIITVNENGSIETFNRAAQRMFGYPFEEAIRKHIDDFLFSGP